MKLRKGDMFESGADVIVFTGNATVRLDGCLVMGRGAARRALELFPGCNKTFGKMVLACGRYPYKMIFDPNSQYPVLGVLQVKHHYADPADLALITASIRVLDLTAREIWKDKRVALNFPGIGWGRLRREDVLPIIETLPNNVEVWEYPE